MKFKPILDEGSTALVVKVPIPFGKTKIPSPTKRRPLLITLNFEAGRDSSWRACALVLLLVSFCYHSPRRMFVVACSKGLDAEPVPDPAGLRVVVTKAGKNGEKVRTCRGSSKRGSNKPSPFFVPLFSSVFVRLRPFKHEGKEHLWRKRLDTAKEYTAELASSGVASLHPASARACNAQYHAPPRLLFAFSLLAR